MPQIFPSGEAYVARLQRLALKSCQRRQRMLAGGCAGADCPSWDVRSTDCHLVSPSSRPQAFPSAICTAPHRPERDAARLHTCAPRSGGEPPILPRRRRPRGSTPCRTWQSSRSNPGFLHPRNTTSRIISGGSRRAKTATCGTPSSRAGTECRRRNACRGARDGVSSLIPPRAGLDERCATAAVERRSGTCGTRLRPEWQIPLGSTLTPDEKRA